MLFSRRFEKKARNFRLGARNFRLGAPIFEKKGGKSSFGMELPRKKLGVSVSELELSRKIPEASRNR
jgi:hypothetical protein